MCDSFVIWLSGFSFNFCRAQARLIGALLCTAPTLLANPTPPANPVSRIDRGCRMDYQGNDPKPSREDVGRGNWGL
jgi:hypothetical protein